MEKEAWTVDYLWQSGKSCAWLWEAGVEYFLAGELRSCLRCEWGGNIPGNRLRCV
jgi:hypothetical protein